MKLESVSRAYIYRLVAVISGAVAILIGCLIVIAPFIPAILLATILCLSTWPAYEWLRKKLKHNDRIAALLMTIGLALCFILPLAVIGGSVNENFSFLLNTVMDGIQADGNTPPAWLSGIPYAGSHIETVWRDYAADKEAVLDFLRKHGDTMTGWLLAVGAAAGKGLLDLSLGVLIAYFLFRHGAETAVRLQKLIEKFGGHRAERLLTVSKNTMISVVYGTVGTAFVQGALATVGFWIAHVPGAAFLGMLTFLLSFLPVGAPLIWAPVALWLLQDGETGYAIFMAVWGLTAVSGIDNLVRPLLIGLGSDLPLLLILLGVLGGIAAFGFIGLFIGPALLSVAYTMLKEMSQTAKEPFANSAV